MRKLSLKKVMACPRVAVNSFILLIFKKLSVLHQFSSVTQLCLPLCDPMDCSMPGRRVHHQLLELTQIHAH